MTTYWMGSCDKCGEHRQLSEFDQYALCAECRLGHAAEKIASEMMPSGCGHPCGGRVNGKPCKALAVCYMGDPDPGGWAGYYCATHREQLKTLGWQVWDNVSAA